MEEERRASRGWKIGRILLVAVVIAVVAGTAYYRTHPEMLAARTARKPGRAPGTQPYVYGGGEFTQFVAESYRQNGGGNPQGFYRWMDQQVQRRKSGVSVTGTWETWLAAQRHRIQAIKDPARRAKAEMDLGAAIHRTIKTIIPKFSLDRGFEFTNTVKLGERQCFLQSVLIAGLLQKAGVDAGVVMVNRNIAGEYSNNGHAVTLVNLADGRDILVDASEPHPFARHTGLMVWDKGDGDYRYVAPVYDASSAITRFTAVDTGAKRSPRTVEDLPVPFLTSMFEYYRGERTPNGPVLKPSNRAGLEASAGHLRKSVTECPDNPLAVYMLGRVEYDLGNKTAARKSIVAAHRLYADYGWMPQGASEMMAQVR